MSNCLPTGVSSSESVVYACACIILDIHPSTFNVQVVKYFPVHNYPTHTVTMEEPVSLTMKTERYHKWGFQKRSALT